MKVFEWIPNKSIGNLVFNMTREEARKIMKKKTDKLVIEGQTDIYCNHLIVKFDENDRMIATELDFDSIW